MERIILGSGELFRTDFTFGMTIADPETYCVDTNRFSYIKNGASLEYAQEKQKEEDDLALVSKTKINTESAKLKAGLMTLEGDGMKYLAATATDPESIAAVANTSVAKKKTKIGGIKNEDETPYLWIFHHIDKKDGDIWIIVAGTHNAELNIEFKPDGANVSNLEVDAIPLDSDGTKVLYFEEVKAA